MNANQSLDAWRRSLREFSEAAFLDRLRARILQGADANRFAARIIDEAGADLELPIRSGQITEADLVKPLLSGTFSSCNAGELAFLLAPVVLDRAAELAGVDSYGTVYLMALYLYSYAREPKITQDGLSPLATGILIREMEHIDCEIQLDVCGFCMWIAHNGREIDQREDAPLYFLALAGSAAMSHVVSRTIDLADDDREGIDYLNPGEGARVSKAIALLTIRIWRENLSCSLDRQKSRIARLDGALSAKGVSWHHLGEAPV